MILERNEFRIRFGKMKDALILWKQIFEEMKNSKDVPKMRLLTDLTGPAYTLVLELRLGSLLDFGFKNYLWMNNEKVTALYQELLPLCESSHRTLYKVELEN
ncbi:MAG: hypothetical protein SH856_05885 [Flavobacteriales bacterium]|nr:hypothetical protein [Flavobacteriales bacterium]